MNSITLNMHKMMLLQMVPHLKKKINNEITKRPI